jgi:hypothetical protein
VSWILVSVGVAFLVPKPPSLASACPEMRSGGINVGARQPDGCLKIKPKVKEWSRGVSDQGRKRHFERVFTVDARTFGTGIGNEYGVD